MFPKSVRAAIVALCLALAAAAQDAAVAGAGNEQLAGTRNQQIPTDAISVNFTDDPLVAGTTPVKALHLTELRSRIDEVRVAVGLGAFAWVDTLTAGTDIKATHVTEMRVALAEAYVARGMTPLPTYTDPGLTAGATIAVAHIAELRAAVVAIVNNLGTSTVGIWRGGTGQMPSLLFEMYVDTGGVIGVVTSVFGSGAGICSLVSVSLNILPPAVITSHNFTVNFSLAGGMGTGVVAGSFSGASATGTIDVTFAGITGCAPIHTTWTAAHVDSGPIAVVSVAATDPNASEVGPDSGTLTVTRQGSVLESLSVQYSLTGSATNGTDYTSLSGFVTILANQASALVTVAPIIDGLVEGSETVVLTLNDRPAYVLGSPTSDTVTIADQPVPIVTIEATDNTATEAGLTTGTFTFTRTGNTTASLTVSYAISGTASHGTDYEFIFSPITIPAGQSSAIRTVTPKQDPLGEPPETVILTLTDGATYNLGPPGTETATVTITSDEVLEALTASVNASPLAAWRASPPAPAPPPPAARDRTRRTLLARPLLSRMSISAVGRIRPSH